MTMPRATRGGTIALTLFVAGSLSAQVMPAPPYLEIFREEVKAHADAKAEEVNARTVARRSPSQAAIAWLTAISSA